MSDDLRPLSRARDALVRAFALDLRSLAAMRIALGTALLLDFSMRFPALEMLVTDAGILTREDVRSLPDATWTASPFFWSGALWPQQILVVLGALAALGMILGYRTRVCHLIGWLLLASLQARNPLALHRGAHTLRVALFWSLPLPLDAVFSVDRARGRVPPPTSLALSNVFTFAFVAQIGILYLFAGLHKTGPAWWGGDGVAMALQRGDLQRGGPSMLLAWPAITQALTVATMVFELLGPFLLVVPLAQPLVRHVFWALAVGFHLGIIATLDLGLFPWMSIGFLLGLTPGRVWGPGPVSLDRGRDPPLVRALVPCLVGTVLLWNVSHHPDLLMGMSPVAGAPIRALRLDQSWAVFSPEPHGEDVWWVVEVERTDGTRTDLLTGRLPTFERPGDLARLYPHVGIWRMFDLIRGPMPDVHSRVARGFLRLARARTDAPPVSALRLWRLHQTFPREGRVFRIRRYMIAEAVPPAEDSRAARNADS